MKDQQVTSKSKFSVHYSVAFRKKVVQEYARGFLNKEQLRKKYGIGGNTTISKWCQKYSNLHYLEKVTAGRPMKDKLKQRIKELERQLEHEKFKVLAYETLIGIVKQEDGIDVLKKGGAKQSVSLPKPAPEK